MGVVQKKKGDGRLSLTKIGPKIDPQKPFLGCQRVKKLIPRLASCLDPIGLCGLLGLNPLKASFFAFLGTFGGPFSLWGLYPTRLGVNLSPTNSISYQPA